VNIDHRTREKTKQSLSDPTPTSLNEVQGKIYSLMEKDSYPRFIRSKMYQEIVNRAYAQGQRRSV
ncbi:Regulator of G-protein signaling 8, partial [Ameca splendens]